MLLKQVYNKNVKKEIKITKETNMAKYICKLCGYVYDEEKGDNDNNIKAGTSFEDLASDWVCPLCLAEKDEFIKE